MKNLDFFNVLDAATQQEILQFAISNDILDVEYTHSVINMQKRREYITKHPYKIWQGKDKKWYTYLPDKKKRCVQRERYTKKEIEDVIVDYWKELEENPTINDVFMECYSRKLENKEISKATYDRYLVDFEKYFVGFSDLKIRSVSEFDIDDFIHKTINTFSLTAKRYSGIRTIIYAIFKYAKKKKFVSFSITNTINDIDISRKSLRQNKKTAESQIFTESELPVITEYLMNNLDILNLGLLLICKTGLRIGELAAIKKEDIQDYTILINRTETRYKDNNGKCIYAIKESPKTEAGLRSAIIPTKYNWIIDKIMECNPDGEWLFEKDGHRIRTYSFRRRLDYICKSKINITSKSPHKIRKTYCTILLGSNIEETLITDVVGHVDISTTKEFYNFDRKSIERKREVLNTVKEL